MSPLKGRAAPLLLLAAALFAFIAMATAMGAGAATEVTQDWYVDGSVEPIVGGEYIMRANLTINFTGQLSVDRVTFTFMSTANGQYGVLVKAQGRLLMDACTFQSGLLSPGKPAKAWTFWAQDASYVVSKRCTFSGCGILGTEGKRQGVAVETNSASFMNCTFRDNNVGLVVLSGAMPTVENNIFEQNAYCGVMVTGNVFDLSGNNTYRENGYGIIFVQCNSGRLGAGLFVDNPQGAVRAGDSIVTLNHVAIEGLYRGIVAEATSTVTAYNCSVMSISAVAHAYTGSKVHLVDCKLIGTDGKLFPDASSSISVKQSVTFKVVYKGVGLPAEGASVRVLDADGTEMVKVATGADGRTVPVQLETHLAKQGPSPVIHRVPFKVEVFRGYDHANLDDFSPVPNELRTIEFIDDVAPGLVVMAPLDRQRFNTTSVLLKGTCQDLQSGLGGLRYTVNGGAAQYLPAQASWEVRVVLPEGELSLVFELEDRAGNNATVVRNILVDVTPPTFLELLPANNSLTRAYNQYFRGRTEAGAKVFVDQTELSVDTNGTFEGFTSLGDEEGPQSIEFRLVDQVGNEGLFLLVLIVDRTPPALSVETEPDYLVTSILNTSAVTFFGLAEPGARIDINRSGEVVASTFANASGKFSFDITLIEGDNDLVVDAWDPAGNRESYEVIRFQYDIIAPEVEVVMPEANFTAVKYSVDSVHLEARTEPDAYIWARVNGRDLPGIVQPAHGEYEIDFDIAEGNNTIVVLARDKAGNVGMAHLRVSRDVKPISQDGEDGFPWTIVVVALAVLVLAIVAAVMLQRRSGRAGPPPSMVGPPPEDGTTGPGKG